MKIKKPFVYLKTLTKVATVITKIRLMQPLTPEEELIYYVHVKGMTEEVAVKLIASRSKI